MRPVDADELLKKIDEEREYLIARGQAGAEHILVHNFRELIENAPTIEQEIYLNGKDYDLYLEGYKQGKKDFERPQGEWVNHKNSYGHNIADCSICGKSMQWHDEDEDGAPRYCWYCGAKMKGERK